MEAHGLTIDQRRAWLLDHIGTHGRASVAELSELFGVSAVTVRTDLQSLAESHLVRRVHGGAVLAGDTDTDPGAAADTGPDAAELVGAPAAEAVDRMPPRQPARGPRRTDRTGAVVPARIGAGEAREARSVGVAAAALVSSGDALLVDGGPVATWLVRALIRRRELRDLTICTNDLDVASELRPAVPRFSVLLAGGALRASGGTLVGPLIGPALDRIRADLCFLGCVGVERDAGVTGADFEHGAVWQRYLTGAERTVLLAPGSAVGRRGQVTYAAVDELDLLVTGLSADDAAVRDLRESGLEVRVVD